MYVNVMCLSIKRAFPAVWQVGLFVVRSVYYDAKEGVKDLNMQEMRMHFLARQEVAHNP